MNELSHLFNYHLPSWRALTAIIVVVSTFALSGNAKQDLRGFLGAFVLGMSGAYGFGLLSASSFADPDWVPYVAWLLMIGSLLAATIVWHDEEQRNRRMHAWMVGFLVGVFLGVMPRAAHPW